MTTLSGIATTAAACLFVYANLGLWQAAVAGAVGASLVFLLHIRLKHDRKENTE
jgi:uncharacterized protein YqfA (UPF0365 family)